MNAIDITKIKFSAVQGKEVKKVLLLTKVFH